MAALVKMLMEDPTTTLQQKVVGIIQLHGAEIISTEEARRYLLEGDAAASQRSASS